MASEQLLDSTKFKKYDSLKQNGSHGHSHDHSNSHGHSHDGRNNAGHGHAHDGASASKGGGGSNGMSHDHHKIDIKAADAREHHVHDDEDDAGSVSSGSGSVSGSDSDTISESGSESSLSSGRKSVNCGGLNPKMKAEIADIAEDPENAKARRKLWMASILCFLFMICEIVGGVFANSLAIMTDAAHLLSDLAGFLISIFALWLATRAPTSRLSFGFHRAEILGALVSVLLIWLLTGILVYEAIFRVRNPQDVDGKLMFIVAATGLGVNICLGFILHQSGHGHSHGLGGGMGEEHGHSHGEEESAPIVKKGHNHSHGDHGHGHGGSDEEGSGSESEDEDRSDMYEDHDHQTDHPKAKNINVTAAFIHVLGDAVQSAGVMIAAGLIWYNPEYKIADPITTFIFSILVLFTTTRLIKQSVGVLMEGVPEGIDPDAVEASLAELPGVLEVHDLHIWSLSIGKPSLSVHLLGTEDCENLLAAANQLCAKRFNIHHSTIQVERRWDKIQCNL